MLFILASVLAVGFVAYMFATSQRKQWVVHLALGLVLAGALGNLYDRLFVKVDLVTPAAPTGARLHGHDHPGPDEERTFQFGDYPDGRRNVMTFTDKHESRRVRLCATSSVSTPRSAIRTSGPGSSTSPTACWSSAWGCCWSSTGGTRSPRRAPVHPLRRRRLHYCANTNSIRASNTKPTAVIATPTVSTAAPQPIHLTAT